METVGRWLVAAGLVTLLIGLVLVVAAQLGLPLGRLPGDIRIERDGFRLYLPLGTCLVFSALLSLVFWALSRLR
jgi:hypothetical protein